MVLGTIFYYYAHYVAKYLHSLWPYHFYSNDGVLFLPGLALKKMITSHAPAEAEALRLVRRHTTIPVPRVYASAKDDRKTYLLMEKIEGESLCVEWKNMSEQQRDELIVQLRGYLAQLRTIPSPYGKRVCSASGGPLWDGRITCTGLVGPFENEANFNEFLIDQGSSVVFPDKLEIIQSKMRDDHNIYFTHGDLAPRNIMIKDGQLSGIIDWGDAGWYPQHWEMVKAMWCPELGSSWDSRVRTLFSDEDKEGWLLDKEISDHLEGVF